MKVAKMVINNYRQFEKAELNFDDNVTILAGANNSGKTSLITLIKNMMSKEQAAYSESDIPAKNMRVWLDKVYPLFEKFYKDNNEIDELETELLDKILPESEESERLVIKTTEVYIQVEGVNNFVSLDFSSGRISTHPKHLRIQCLQGFVGSAHTRPPE